LPKVEEIVPPSVFWLDFGPIENTEILPYFSKILLKNEQVGMLIFRKIFTGYRVFFFQKLFSTCARVIAKGFSNCFQCMILATM